MDAKTKAMLESYGRSFLAACTTAFMLNGGDIFAMDAQSFKTILAAGISAVLPVVLRYFNKKDPAFGMIAEQVAAKGMEKLTAPKKAVAKKAPAKKAVAKKVAK
jgi:hypothetical protein